ncbi:MAG: sigma-70 family RNA polymerase sigma factor [Erysipelotrichaceae bacterium]|nr:sigma-70 family RNA polymerase sigma factor [Erysipelotrichaceae bacterium]
MEDKDIVALYLDRDEKAIYETKIKYGHYCYSIAYNILHNNEDSQECVNDTYLNTWNTIPPHIPNVLSTFIGKITRRLSIDKYRKLYADKRGGGEYALSLDEIGECVASNNNTEKEVDEKILVEKINYFLSRINTNERNVFVCRYFYFDSIEEIANRFNYSQSKVKMMLSRTRDKLKVYLEKEGY